MTDRISPTAYRALAPHLEDLLLERVDVQQAELDDDLTFVIGQIAHPDMSAAVAASLAAKAIDVANCESSFSKRPERVRSFRAVTAPGQTGVVRNEQASDE